MNTNVKSLREIPETIFEEVIDTHGQRQYDCFGETSTSICACRESGGSNGPFTARYENHLCSLGRLNCSGFHLYRGSIKTLFFEPYYEGFVPVPAFSLKFFADDPPYSSILSDPKWEQGKGYWVSHQLKVCYGGFPDHQSSVISSFGDWEFGFLLEIQRRAHELAKSVEIRGHWQVEWNPKGDFSKKFVLEG